jgi:hypothetical protein
MVEGQLLCASYRESIFVPRYFSVRPVGWMTGVINDNFGIVSPEPSTGNPINKESKITMQMKVLMVNVR